MWVRSVLVGSQATGRVFRASSNQIILSDPLPLGSSWPLPRLGALRCFIG